MKKMFKQTLVFAALAMASGFAAAQITNTPHNLTSTGPGPNTQSNTDQICVFCHTPHGSNQNVEAPLWNKANTATTFTTYSTQNSSTIDGAVLEVGSVSLACLSCHDGTQAMDNMFNAPGSGTGVGDGTAGVSQNYSWTGSNVVTGIANLGADLTNDHPIGIQYCGGGVSGTGTTVNGTCADADFIGPGGSQSTRLRTANINNQQVFWVNVGADNAIRSSTDIILYTRDFVGNGGFGPSVECASCHDPHVSAANRGGEMNFMRVTTAGSQICLACHVK